MIQASWGKSILRVPGRSLCKRTDKGQRGFKTQAQTRPSRDTAQVESGAQQLETRDGGVPRSWDRSLLEPPDKSGSMLKDCEDKFWLGSVCSSHRM